MRPPLALLAVLALAGCGGGAESDDAAPPAAPEPLTTAAPPEVSCSTAGLRLVLPEQELPEPVAELRRQVFGAAIACDYDSLAALTSPKGFTYSYGEAGGPAAYWRKLEQEQLDDPMATLVTILALEPGRNEIGFYTWPGAHQESPSDADWQAVVDAGLYTQEQIDSMREGGSGYLGWRTGIAQDGTWQFFVAGD